MEKCNKQYYKLSGAQYATSCILTKHHIVGILGMGVPRLAYLRPAAWLSQQAVGPIFTNKAPKTLVRGQASRGGRRKTSSGVA